MSSNEGLYQIADELRAVASLGLRFAANTTMWRDMSVSWRPAHDWLPR